MYTARGWAIFPCKHESKAPATAHGFKDASRDPAQLAAWAQQYPGANVAFEPGRAGLVLIDFDATDGPAGDLLRRMDAEAPTLRAKSPTGNPHRYYALPSGTALPSATNRPVAGVDVRSSGGYVLLAPSVVTYAGKDAAKKGVPDGYTGAYAWENDLEPAPVPAWLLEALRTPRPASQQHTEARNGADEKTSRKTRPAPRNLSSISEAATALGALNPARCNNYGDWIAVGQALQELGSLGLGLWDEWSRSSAKYQEGACSKKWDSFKRTGRGIGTLFYMAGQDSPGYRSPQMAPDLPTTFGDEGPPPDAPIPGTRSLREVADNLQAWALSPEFAGKLREAEIKRLDGPRAVYVALCTLARQHNTFTLRPGLRGLGELAGMSHESARNNLERLASAGLVTIMCAQTLTVCLAQGGTTVKVCAHMVGEIYAHSLSDDAFATYPMKWAEKRRPGVELIRGMGRGAAVPWAYMLTEGGVWTVRSLSEATGMTRGTARSALNRLAEAGLAMVEREKAYAPNVYTLVEDVEAVLDTLRPIMASFGSNARRALHNALQAAAWAYRNTQSGPEWQRPRQEVRRKQADATAYKWAQHLERNGINWRARVQPMRPVARQIGDLGRVKPGEAQRLVDHARMRVMSKRLEREDALQAMDDDYWQRTMSAPPAIENGYMWVAD